MVFFLGASLSPEDELNAITGRPTLSLSFEGLYPAEGPVGALHPPPPQYHLNFAPCIRFLPEGSYFILQKVQRITLASP